MILVHADCALVWNDLRALKLPSTSTERVKALLIPRRICEREHCICELVWIICEVVVLAIPLGQIGWARDNIMCVVEALELAVDVILCLVSRDRAQTGIRVVPLVAWGCSEVGKRATHLDSTALAEVLDEDVVAPLACVVTEHRFERLTIPLAWYCSSDDVNNCRRLRGGCDDDDDV